VNYKRKSETPVLLAHAIEDSTDIFGIWGGGFEHPKPPLGTPLGPGYRYLDWYATANTDYV